MELSAEVATYQHGAHVPAPPPEYYDIRVRAEVSPGGVARYGRLYMPEGGVGDVRVTLSGTLPSLFVRRTSFEQYDYQAAFMLR